MRSVARVGRDTDLTQCLHTPHRRVLPLRTGPHTLLRTGCRVAEVLHVHLAVQVREKRPSDMNPYVQYLKGAHLLKKRRPDDVRRAFEYFQEAIRLDPGFAEPYYGAAMFYNVSAAYGVLPPRSVLPHAEELLSKGLALDENSTRLYSTLGMLRVFQWRWAEAEQAYRRAISLEPTNAFPHMAYPILCSFLSRHNEAFLHAGKAVELEPLDLMTNFRLLQANYYSRRYDEAVRTGRIAIELTPDSPYTCFYLALFLAALGLKEEAWSTANKGRKLNDGLPLGEGYFGYVAGALGHTAEARSVVRELEAGAQEVTTRRCPLHRPISDWAKQLPPSNAWRQLLPNTSRSWDRRWYSPLTMRSATKQDSCG